MECLYIERGLNKRVLTACSRYDKPRIPECQTFHEKDVTKIPPLRINYCGFHRVDKLFALIRLNALPLTCG